jgi:hypothetical protein
LRAGGSDRRVRAGGVWVCVVGSERNGKNGKTEKLLIHNDLAFPFSVPFSVPFGGVIGGGFCAMGLCGMVYAVRVP